MKYKALCLSILATCMAACVEKPEQTDVTEQSEIQDIQSSLEIVGVVGDGTSMHVLELVTFDNDSLYFTYEVNSTDGIDVGDTVIITYDQALGEDVALNIKKITNSEKI